MGEFDWGLETTVHVFEAYVLGGRDLYPIMPFLIPHMEMKAENVGYTDFLQNEKIGIIVENNDVSVRYWFSGMTEYWLHSQNTDHIL